MSKGKTLFTTWEKLIFAAVLAGAALAAYRPVLEGC
ncbi:hypothetical protein PPS11_15896 [Pseudomonas putida S11]|nr:hypothetical protein PPS11_15896 [Pseudomonas putida S11]